MRLRITSLTGRVAAATTTLGLAVAALAMPVLASPAHAQEATSPTPALRVMTRNLYLGTDIMRPLNALAGLPADATDTQRLNALANATDTARGIVDKTDFNVRAGLLAKEFASQQPDLVGLQEVALWRHGPFEPLNVAVPNATTVDYDFLKILQGKLRALGLRYRAVSVNWLSDVEAPAYTGTLGDPASPIQNPRDVRLTMRDVILKRVGSGIAVLRHHERKYKSGLSVSIAGKKLDFTRGYQWIDARRAGKTFRFINTHLEAFSSDMAYQQIGEMLAGPGSYKGTTIIVCDCNSDPLNGNVKKSIGDTMPHWAPYWLATGKYGFSDSWLQWKQAQYGWTSGLSETVDDPTAAAFDHRIDMVFNRTGDGGRLRVTRGTVVGNTVASKDPATGLWPSDHAGVVMRLRVR